MCHYFLNMSIKFKHEISQHQPSISVFACQSISSSKRVFHYKSKRSNLLPRNTSSKIILLRKTGGNEQNTQIH